MIDSFRGKYAFLSNFYKAPFLDVDGKKWMTVEHFFQAMKTKDILRQEAIRKMETPSEAKCAGRRVVIRSDWPEVKESVMKSALRMKFWQNEDLAKKLMMTMPKELVEGNTWHDCEWGICRCERCGGKGKNNLGKLLMELRKNLHDWRKS